MIAGDLVALLIHAQAAVSIAVKGKTNVQTILHNELLEMLNVGAAAIGVDVVAIGGIVHHVGLGAQRFEHALGDLPGSAIGHIQTHLHILEAVLGHGNQVADVAVAARGIVHRAADLVALSNRHIHLAVDVVFHQQDGFLVHLLAVAVEQLDAVIIVGVVGSGDHDAAVEIIHAGDIGHGRRGGHVHDVSIRAGSHQTGAQGVLEHIGAATGVLADDDLGLLALLGTVVPAQEPTDLYRMFKGQILIGLAAETVRTKILTHDYRSSL